MLVNKQYIFGGAKVALGGLLRIYLKRNNPENYHVIIPNAKNPKIVG